METLHLLYAVVGATSVVLALGSARIRELPLSEPLVALVLGVLLGPAVLGRGLLAVVRPLTAEVAGGAAIGFVLGALAGRSLRWATSRGDLSPGPDLVLSLLLAVATLGVARIAGTGGVLAVFVAGLSYNRAVGEGERGGQDRIDEAVNRCAVVPLFVVLGIVLPWGQWAAWGLPAVAFVLAVLLVRRLPVVLALHRPLRLARHDAVFTGWFGPVGVSAVFYLAHTVHEGVTDPRVFAAGTLAIAVSVVVFGLTATPGRRLYVRAVR